MGNLKISLLSWGVHSSQESQVNTKKSQKTVGVLSAELWDRRQKGKVGHKLLSYIGE